MTSSKFIAPLSVACMFTALGCAEAVPKELADARAAYDRASHGPAAQLSPADLHAAETSLNDAERAFEDDGNTQTTRDLAYMAERRAQIAEVHARTSAANATAERLAAQQAKARDARYGQMEQQLNETQQELAQRQAALAQEQARRAEAEQRARQAMNDLARVAAVKEEARGTVITLSGSVLFESGKSELRPVAEARLGQVAQALTEADPDSQIVVQGYTDSQGSQKFNEKLSLDRAESVRSFLVTRGVAADRIRAEGLGPANPVADNKSPEGRANNRRVEIVVSPSGASKGATPSTTQSPTGA